MMNYIGGYALLYGNCASLAVRWPVTRSGTVTTRTLAAGLGVRVDLPDRAGISHPPTHLHTANWSIGFSVCVCVHTGQPRQRICEGNFAVYRPDPLSFNLH